MDSLAIVIPAYKELYLKQSLQSLANQTNKKFTVYIGDDCSPYGLKKIVDGFKETLTIHYKRFDTNMGGQDLVTQWARCIQLTHDENWLWLFSDDDIADSNCVEAFYRCLNKHSRYYDVYRFNTMVIDKAGVHKSACPTGPEIESAEEMAYFLLLEQRGNSMPDHIFSRQIYDSTGGFVNTHFAQSADWATSIKFSKNKGICIIQDAKVYWRLSEHNVSAANPSKRADMIRGYLQFAEWILHHFQYLKSETYPVTYHQIQAALFKNMKSLLRWHYKGIPVILYSTILIFLFKRFNISYLQGIKFIYRINRASK